jgi:pyruvate dehydrogenase E2 component (dihydrolipoamide acetyltransferase)
VYEFKLPDLGEGIHEGEILKWHVTTGDTIQEDAPLVDVETDKAAVTIPSPRGGKIVSLGGGIGDTVNVGQVITVIDDGTGVGTEAAVQQPQPAAPTRPSAAAPSTSPPARPAPAGPAPTGPAPAGAAPAERAAAAPPAAEPAAASPAAEVPAPPAGPAAPPAAPGRGPVPAAPATRRLARELKIDIGSVPGTGPGGRVTVEDVRRFAAGAAAPAAAQAPVEGTHVPADTLGDDQTAIAEFAAHAAATIPFLDIEPLPDFTQWGPVQIESLRSIRRKVARKMVTSMILVPHVAHMDEADVTLLEEFRQKEKERRKGQPGGRLTLLAFVIKAVTAGLKAAPAFNASLDPFKQEIIYKAYYNIGIAVDTGRGLIVPVIKNTDRKSIIQIARDIEDLANRARQNKLEVDDLRGGTFTITNVGPLGGTALLPTINYPEVAILGMGQVQKKPVVRNDQIVIRMMLPLTLAFDHRIADGADAARFVGELALQLSDPNLLLLET